MDQRKTFVVFYSWQSDLPNETNRQAIRSAVHGAVAAIEKKIGDISITIDEATRDVPGSPDIPMEILTKVIKSDMFLCDITTINTAFDGRKMPNPNVVFELGYAVAHLGWNRIVMLFNEEYGTFGKDIPFDFDRHRASSYRLSQALKSKNEAALKELLVEAIEMIIDKQPERPSSVLSPEQIRHERDVQKLRWLLNTLHLPTLDKHVDECPQKIYGPALEFWEDFNAIYRSSLFSLYDNVMYDLIDKFHTAYQNTVCHGEHYASVGSSDVFRFIDPPDVLKKDKRKEKVWHSILKSAGAMKNLLSQIIDLIHQSYIEIDIEETSRVAWVEHVAFIKEQEELMNSWKTST